MKTDAEKIIEAIAQAIRVSPRDIGDFVIVGSDSEATKILINSGECASYVFVERVDGTFAPMEFPAKTKLS
jgi:hypothetical protein